MEKCVLWLQQQEGAASEDLLCLPTKAARRSKSCFSSTQGGHLFLNRRQLPMRSRSVRMVSCFVDRDLAEQEAERDPPKLQGGCALAKNPMRPAVRIDWPECLRRSLKRSCHDRQLVCRKREEFPPDHRPDACVRLRLRWILSENQTCPGPALAMTNAGISSAWKGR